MDPRHPESAVTRMEELMLQFKRVEEDMADATTSAQLSMLEREGSLVVQEICLVAPRLHEAMVQSSRLRRYDLSHALVIPKVEEVKVEEEKVVEKAEEEPAKVAEEVEEAPKPKKKTTKKKKAEKAE